MWFNIYIIATFFINKFILSIEILGKYVSISTYNNSIIFNSTDFSKGDIMSFKFQINNSQDDYNNNTCQEQLEYEYYDNINDITYNNTRYSIKATLSEKSNSIRYFNINKTESELNTLEGNYLLLYFNCDNLVTIENIRKKQKTKNNYSEIEEKNYKQDYIVGIVFVVVFVIFMIICIKCCCSDMKQSCEVCSKCLISFLTCCWCCCLFSPRANDNISQEHFSQRQEGVSIYSRNQHIPPSSSSSSVDVVKNQ
jgi:hypothetical protein